MNALCKLLSFFLHPLFMPTYLYALLSWALPAALSPLRVESHLVFIMMVFFLTFGLPAINLGIFRVFGNISSVTMPKRTERLLPFILISIIYLITTYVLYSKLRIAPNDSVMRFLLIIDVMVILSTVITFFFKISVHSVAIWGVTGMVLLLTKISQLETLLYASVGLIVLSGLVMAARLQLGVHTYREVMWGSVVGLGCSIAGMLILF